MNTDSIVVMESGAGWPTWVDEEAGAVSSVVVLSRHRGETVGDFEARARSRLCSLAELSAPRRGVLVCGASGGQQSRAARERLVRVLLDVVGQAGGSEVVLIGDDMTLVGRLSGHVQQLNRRPGSEHSPLSLRLRRAPSGGEPVPARRVA